MSRPYPHRGATPPSTPPSNGSPRPAPAQASLRPLAPATLEWLEASSHWLPLSERTVLELARRIHQWQKHPAGPDGAPAALKRRALRARDHLVRHNLRLIGHTWGRHRSTLPGGEEGTLDAFQEAALALVRAAEKFDPSRGYRFSTYASFWVRRGFCQHQRRGKRLIRLPHDKVDVIGRAMRLMAQELERNGAVPPLAWVAERCGPGGQAMAPAELEALLEQWRRTAPMELDRPVREAGQPTTLLALVPDPAAVDVAAFDAFLAEADFPDGVATYATCAADSRDPQRSLLPLLLERLDPVSRRLLWHRYLREHPLTRRQIKRVMGLAVEEQERLEAEALALLRRAAQEHAA
ncbi:MAG: sigma-70 family RNA polymerase sigma factor [Cyanobacteriota bacterium]